MSTVNAETKRVLFTGPLVRIEKVSCHRAQRGLSCEECKSEHQIGIPLSGVNVREVGGKRYTISPAHVTLSNRGEAYRVGHPYGSGETQLNIVLNESLLFEMLEDNDRAVDDRDERPFRARQVPIHAKLHFAARLIAAQATALPTMQVEESAIALIERILASNVAASAHFKATQRDRDLAHRAQALLAGRYAQAIALQDIAATLNVSVYHLCRAFKRASGATLWSEIRKLRTRAALSNLEAGERDLTSLGLALGYSHHSHFTSSFRRELGITPSAARRLFETGSVAEVRALLSH